MGERLKELRTQHGLSQEQVGKRLGLSKGAIGAYENNTNMPPADVLAHLAVMYNTSSDYILGLNSDDDTIKLSLQNLDKHKRNIIKQIIYLAKELLQNK